MHHPFDGILLPPTDVGSDASRPVGVAPHVGRRSFFWKCFAGTAAAVAILFGRRASAQDPSFYGGGRFGGSWGQGSWGDGRWRSPGNITTYALGEEGGGWERPGTPPGRPDGGYTTRALGEEGGGYHRPPPGGGQYTTMALGEEGGQMTTMALGEEGGRWR